MSDTDRGKGQIHGLRCQTLSTPTPDERYTVYILCPGSTESAGGVGRAMSYVIAHWASQENAPRVVFINTRGSYHIAFSPFFFLLALSRIVGIAISRRTSILHVNISNKGSALRKFIIVALASLLRLRMVLHSHDGSLARSFPQMPQLSRVAMRWMFGQGHRVVVLGEYWKRYFVQHLEVAPEKIEVICNGVPGPPQPIVRQTSDGITRILYLGKLTETKGVSELLTALASKQLARLEWHATLAGDGDREGYMKKAEAHGLGKRTYFPGWLDNLAVKSLLSQADILVLPSYFEALPLAVLEALANAVPIICTPVGALPDYLTDRRSALFVKPGDAEGLANALDLLIRSSDCREKLAAEGRKVFRAHFDVSETAQKLEQVYQKVRNSTAGDLERRPIDTGVSCRSESRPVDL